VVRAADHARRMGPVVLLAELRVDEARALGRLDVGELRAGARRRRPVDRALVPADVVAERLPGRVDARAPPRPFVRGDLRARVVRVREGVVGRGFGRYRDDHRSERGQRARGGEPRPPPLFVVSGNGSAHRGSDLGTGTSGAHAARPRRSPRGFCHPM